VYNGKLYCIHEGRGYSGYLWYTTFDGTSWSQDQQLTTSGNGNVGTSGSPALAVYNGKLYCIHEGRGHSGYLWYTTFDGTTWTADQQLTTSGNGNVGTSGPPALVAYQDKLLCIHEGRANAGYLWYTVFDGGTWSQDQQLPDQKNNYGTSGAPGLAVYQDTLYCIHQGRSNAGYLWYATHEPALTVHVWTFTLEAWGHASLTLPDGTHISWWPSGNPKEESIMDLDEKVRATLPAPVAQLISSGAWATADVYSAPAFPGQTFQNDMEDEAPDIVLPNGKTERGPDKPPDYQMPITVLDVPGIKAWWDTFRNDPNNLWKTFTQNCSTTIADALYKGNVQFIPFQILRRFPSIPGLWTPTDIMNFANNIGYYNHVGPPPR
jgi:hypothetical protein